MSSWRWVWFCAVVVRDNGRVRPGQPRSVCGACEPVVQRGGGGLPRGPWIVAFEHERQTSALFPALPGTDIAITKVVMWKGAVMEMIHSRCAGLDVSKRDAKVCVRIVGQGRAGTKHTVTTWSSMTNQVLALLEHHELPTSIPIGIPDPSTPARWPGLSRTPSNPPRPTWPAAPLATNSPTTMPKPPAPSFTPPEAREVWAVQFPTRPFP